MPYVVWKRDRGGVGDIYEVSGVVLRPNIATKITDRQKEVLKAMERKMGLIVFDDVEIPKETLFDEKGKVNILGKPSSIKIRRGP